MERVSDVMPRAPIAAGVETDFRSMLNIDVVITAIQFAQGLFGEYAILGYKLNESDTEKLMAVRGDVVIKKLHFLQDQNKLPILGKFVKDKVYYDLQ